MVRSPGFAPAASQGRDRARPRRRASRPCTLQPLLASPTDLRVALLRTRWRRAGRTGDGPTATTCPTERWVPPAMIARCTLARRRARARRAHASKRARSRRRRPPRARRAASAARIALLSRARRGRSRRGLLVARDGDGARRARARMGVAAVSLGRGHAGALPSAATRPIRRSACWRAREPCRGRGRRRCRPRSTSSARARAPAMSRSGRRSPGCCPPPGPPRARSGRSGARYVEGLRRGSTASSSSPPNACATRCRSRRRVPRRGRVPRDPPRSQAEAGAQAFVACAPRIPAA